MKRSLEIYGVEVPFNQTPILPKRTRNYSISCVEGGINRCREKVEPVNYKHFSCREYTYLWFNHRTDQLSLY